MKSISKIKESEKFNKFIKECEEFALENETITEISNSFPRFILKLFFELDRENIEYALEGLGSRDEGIDAFFVSEKEKKYYLIQFKSRKHFDEREGKDAKKEWFSLLHTFNDRIKQGFFQTKNKRIITIKEQINEDLLDYKFEYHIFHLGYVSEEIEGNFPEVIYHSQSEIINKFVQYYEQDLSDDLAPDEVVLEIKPQQFQNFNNLNNYIFFTPKAKHGKARKTIIFPLTGEQILDLINEGTTILQRNVRGYLGDSNAVNKGIIRTALNDPEHFYFFNNGISITCDEIAIIGANSKNPKIKLKKPQIINGAQTVNSLKSAYEIKLKELKKQFQNHQEKALNHMNDIHVICKIMESNKHTNTSFSKEITQYNNTQNKVKATDFYANRPEQERIKESLLKYDITYNIKRGKTFETRKGFFINMENLAEHYWAQKKDPFHAKASNIFLDNCENEDNSIYTQIFGNNGIYSRERTLELAKTFYTYHFLTNLFMYIRNTFNQIENLIGKDKNIIDSFEKDNQDFFKITGSKKYFHEIVQNKPDPYIDIISKYILIMDLKIISYISRELIESSKIKNNSNEYRDIKIVLEDYIVRKNHSSIELLIKSIFIKSLKLYADSIKEISRDYNIQKRHPKTKEFKNIVDQKISEFISDDDLAIPFEY